MPTADDVLAAAAKAFTQHAASDEMALRQISGQLGELKGMLDGIRVSQATQAATVAANSARLGHLETAVAAIKVRQEGVDSRVGWAYKIVAGAIVASVGSVVAAVKGVF